MEATRRAWRWTDLHRALSTEWRELGGLGRTALIGVVMSALVALALGFTIPAVVSRHVLESRMEMLGHIVDGLVSGNMLPLESNGRSTAAFDEAVRLRLLGGETVRVKLWDPSGQVVYSDATGLVGQRFGLDQSAQAALRGQATFEISDVAAPENVLEAGFGELLEFYLPVRGPNGQVRGLFEVYQTTATFREAMAEIQRAVWLSILTGLGLLGLFMGTLTVANARVFARRNREVESLLGRLVRAEEHERSHILGALHDDVGQPLYRLLYGLEAARRRVGGGELAAELGTLETITREIEGSLRTELRNLRRDLSEELGLEPALADLVDSLRRDSDLAATLEVTSAAALEPEARRALYCAAREALANVRRHARAHSALVELRATDRVVILEVTDDGIGVQAREGIGLTVTRQRLAAVGGQLTVRRRPSGGTLLWAAVPRTVPAT